MEALKSKNINEPVILLKILDNGSLLVVDKNTTVRYFDLNTLALADGFKANIYHRSYKSSIVAFANNNKQFVSITPDCEESVLYNISNKKMITKVERHHGEVSCVGIDPLCRYMFSCGEDGKTYALDLKSGKLVFTLPIHVDTVNDIAFSKDSHLLATASYDKKVSLFNLTTMTAKAKFRAHDAPVMKLRFLNRNRLLSIDKKSVAIVWNYNSSKVLQRLEGIHDDITHIITSKNDKFLFIGTELGYIFVYDLKTYEMLSEKYIKLHSSITALEFDNTQEQLIVGTQDGEINFYNIYEGESELQELLKQKNFEGIQEKLDNNPLLEYTKIYNLITNLWDAALKKAILSLEKGNKDKAISIFRHFKEMPSKNKIMQKVMIEYVDFEKFAIVAKQGKLQLAYGLASTHPMYKTSSVYRTLEENWKSSFRQARKYVIDPRGAQQIKDILAPYRGISEKTKLIQDLLTKGEVYKRFKVSIGQKEFRIAFELIKLNPFLREFPEYEVLMTYADSLYIKSKKLIATGDTHSAIKLLRVLEEFDDFKEEVYEMILGIESRQKFFNAVEDEDLMLAYDLMARFEELQGTDDGKELQKQWSKDLSVANGYAVDGDVVGIKKSLDTYMKIRSKYIHLATVFGWCYMVQLENAIKSKADRVKLENGIKNYMLSFGLEDQIENFFKLFKENYPKSKLNLEHLTHGSINMWRPSMIENSILD